MKVTGRLLYFFVRTRRSRLAWAGLTVIALAIGQCLPITAASSYYRASEHPEGAGEPQPSLASATAKHAAVDSLARMALHFEACDSFAPARFLARTNESTVYLSATEATLSVRASAGAGRLGRVADLGSPRNARSPQATEQLPEPRRDRAAPRPHPLVTVHMQLVGANLRALMVGENQLPTRTSYFTGKDSKRWRTDLPNFARVKVEQVYRGIDMVYYGSGQQQLEYDFRVAPGADFKAIRLRFAGARSVQLDQTGDLVIETNAGTLRHRKPIAYQQIDGARKDVAARYVVTAHGEVKFTVEDYDKRSPLVIDPVLSFATYFGSPQGGEIIRAVAVDASGSAYVVGTSATSLLPTTPGAVQSINHARAMFIAKLNPTGTVLLYCTYLGGSATDDATGIAVDAAGNAYVTGATLSADFPTTTDAFQRERGAFRHPIVAKLNAAGTALLYSTYLGAKEENAGATGIAVDASGQATITGYTDSQNFPTTANAPQPKSVAEFDSFIARLNSDGSALVYATYLGGSSSDIARAIAVDGEGNAYVAGDTSSKDFPTTKHAFKRDGDGSGTSFAAKINAAGDKLVYSTYVAQGSTANGIAADANGNAYLTGYVVLSSFPTTPGALQPTSGGGFDAFVTKLNTSGSDLVYSTFLGGSGSDSGSAIAVDSVGQAYVTGSTTSSDFATAQPLQPRKRGGPLFKSTDAGASWDDVRFVVSPSITSLAVDPQTTSTLYAATYSTVIKSTDSGATWRILTTGLSGSIVIDPVRPMILYVVGGYSVFKSVDAGVSWQQVQVPVFGFFGISALVIDAKTPDTLYLGAHQTAIPNVGGVRASAFPDAMFKSTDAGASWKPIAFGLQVLGVESLAIDPQVPSTIYACTSAFSTGLLKSTDAGANWFKPMATGATYLRQLVIDPANSSTLYGAGIVGVLKSTNGGASWSQTTLEPKVINSLAIDPRTPATIYGSGYDGLYQTTDGGANWRRVLDLRYGNGVAVDPGQPATIYVPATAVDDMFVAKLNAAGTALGYSTYLGGSAQDYGLGIAVDPYGNACAVGYGFSANFPVTPDAYQIHGTTFDTTGIIVRITDPITLHITSVTIKGKKLFVSGEGFHKGAVIVVNGTDLETENDAATPATLLISKRGGKQIARGQTVTVRVRDADGKLSDGFSFTRGLD